MQLFFRKLNASHSGKARQASSQARTSCVGLSRMTGPARLPRHTVRGRSVNLLGSGRTTMGSSWLVELDVNGSPKTATTKSARIRALISFAFVKEIIVLCFVFWFWFWLFCHQELFQRKTQGVFRESFRIHNSKLKFLFRNVFYESKKSFLF